jgi:hypothetical protein
MKLHTLILLAALPLALPANAEPLEVARVDMSRVQSQFNQYLGWLNAPKSMRIALRDVDDKIEALRTDMMEATDKTKLDQIQKRLSFLQSKRSMLLSTVNTSSSYWQQGLNRFIKKHFGPHYPLIFQQNSYNITQYSICGEIRETDITDQVIDAIAKDLGLEDEHRRQPD